MNGNDDTPADDFADTSAAGEHADGEQADVEAEAQAPRSWEERQPLFAIVGRPNVGKSRLFNRMTRTRFAIVEDMPGVTRDRQYGEGKWDGRGFQVVDTGGFEPESVDELLMQMRGQAQLAMEEADAIIFVLDGQSGLLPADREIAALLRTSDKPVYAVVNKIDGPGHDANVSEFYSLGLPCDLIALSAEHGRGFSDLMDELEAHMPKVTPKVDEDLIRIAVVGVPNAGKSTLVNRLIGEDRLLTSNIPGTTRDAINTHLERNGQRYMLIDTAGIRRKRSISEAVEKMSVVQAFKSLDRADVAILVLDATRGVTAQDQRICGLANTKGCALIIILNKWDTVEKDHRTADEYAQKVRDNLKFAPWAPVLTMSALTGQRSHRVLDMVDEVFASYCQRISTAAVNRYLEKALRRKSPPQKGGRRLKLFYGSQVATRPPTFMFAINNPEMMHFSYERYLLNGLREEFPFRGTPIKIFFRGRGKADRDAGN